MRRLRLTACPVLLLAMLLLTLLAGPARADCGVAALGVTPGAASRVEIGTSGRSMLVYVPLGWTASRPAPLLFLFHGSTGDGAGVLKSSRLTATADRHHFVIAAPDGGIPAHPGHYWNIPGVPTPAGKLPDARDADDVGFVVAAIDWLTAQRCIDRSRVYATGISAGGRMASWLGCVAADRIAAIAPVVGLRAGHPLTGNPRQPDPATCTPTEAMPLIAFAGFDDTTNPIAGGGKPYWQYPLRAAERRWADLDGCRVALPERELPGRLIERRYTKCRDGAEVVSRIALGRGHEWVADDEAMWAFLSRFRRR